MKKTGIMNIALSELTATLGHGDRIAVVDRGFPLPMNPKVRVIDLALSKNMPTVEMVVETLLKEVVFEEMTFSNETMKESETFYAKIRDMILDQNKACTEKTGEHLALKSTILSGGQEDEIRGYIRTGDFTFFGYVLLTAGVAFN